MAGRCARYARSSEFTSEFVESEVHLLRTRLHAEAPKTWRNIRAVSRDRLPMVGPVLAPESGLWTVGGFGSRGLTWAVLCAELLAAQLHGEPFPIESSLAAKLDLR